MDSAVVRLVLSFSPFRVDICADCKLLVGPRRKVLKSSKLLAMLNATTRSSPFQSLKSYGLAVCSIGYASRLRGMNFVAGAPRQRLAAVAAPKTHDD